MISPHWIKLIPQPYAITGSTHPFVFVIWTYLNIKLIGLNLGNPAVLVASFIQVIGILLSYKPGFLPLAQSPANFQFQ